MRYFGKSGLALLACPAFAQSQSQDELLSPAGLIERLFGVDPTTLLDIFSSADATALGAISMAANIAGVAVALVIIAYTLFSALVDTGRTGEVGGRRVTAWSVARWVLTLGLLAPGTSGYSTFQGLLLYTANLGSNVASDAWKKVEEDILDTSNLAGQIDGITGSAKVNAARVVHDLYRINLCEAVADKLLQDSSTVVFGVPFPQLGVERYETENESQLRWDWRGTNGIPGLDTLSEGVCGTLEQSLPPLTAGPERQVRIEASEHLLWLNTRLRGLADKDVNTAWTSTSRQQALAYYVKSYNARSIATVQSAVQGAGGTAEQLQIAHYRQHTANAGWLAAGAYLWTYSAALSGLSALQRAATDASIMPPDTDRMPTALVVEYDIYSARFEKNLGRFTAREAQAFNEASTSVDLNLSLWLSSWSGALTRLSEWVSRLCLLGVKSTASLITDGGDQADPLGSLQSLGYGLMSSGEVAWGIALGTGLFKAGTNMAVKMAKDIPGVGHVISDASDKLLWTAGTIGTYLMVTGAFLALYLPAIPLLLWIGGIVSWLLLLVETILVAPIWATAHAMPENEGLAGQYAKQGYLVFAGVVFRPILMVGGLLGALLVARAALGMVVPMYSWFLDLAFAPSTINPITAAVLLAIFVLMVIYLIRQCFSLIHLVPDRALRFIGSGDSMGEGIREQAIHGSLDQAASRSQHRVESRLSKKPEKEPGAIEPGKKPGK